MLFSKTADFDEFHKLKLKVRGAKNIKERKTSTKLNETTECQSTEVLRVSRDLIQFSDFAGSSAVMEERTCFLNAILRDIKNILLYANEYVKCRIDLHNISRRSSV